MGSEVLKEKVSKDREQKDTLLPNWVTSFVGGELLLIRKC